MTEKVKIKYKFSFSQATIFLLIGVLLVAIYFSFFTIITPDGIGYYNYLEILKGDLPLSSWDPVRGPTMPLIIFGIVKLFGDTSLGFLMGTFLFFLVMIGVAYLIIRGIIKSQNNSTIRLIIWILFVFLFVFNPLIIGYYHVMLTEFVAATVAMVCCLLSIKWVNIEVKREKEKTLLFSVFFIIICPLMWFLKQPYVLAVFIPFFLGTMMSIVKKSTFTNIFVKLSVFLLCILSVITSISLWDNILTSNGSTSSLNKTNSFLTSSFTYAISNFRLLEYEVSHSDEFVNSTEQIDSREMELMSEIVNDDNEETDYNLYQVLSIIDSLKLDIIVVPDLDKDIISVKDTIHFFKVSTVQYPLHVLSSYILNYLGLIDLIYFDSQLYLPIKSYIKPNELHGENEVIGLAIYNNYSTVLGNPLTIPPIAREKMPQYVNNNPSNLLSDNILMKLIRTSLHSLTIVLLLSPILFVILFLLFISNKKYRLKPKSLLFESCIILFGFSFLEVLFHALTGAIVDRYSFIAYPTALLGFILLLNFISLKKKNLYK